MSKSVQIAVVIPSYKVTGHVLDVLKHIGPEVARIYVVDDHCPDGSGKLVEKRCTDKRVKVIYNPENLGVGGATMAGFQAALDDGAGVIVKLDGDGQMDPALIPAFVQPILDGAADYTKGNRFFEPDDVRAMPGIRLFGNAMLSFVTKLSSGYWDIFDPANGYLAIHHRVAAAIPFDKVSRDFFFESDMLFRLNIIRAVVLDIPMKAVYGDEKSNLKPHKVGGTFLWRNMRNFFKRIFYNHFLRDFSVASAELMLGSIILLFGVLFGGKAWLDSILSGTVASAGTVMLAALPTLVGIQLLLSFFSFDMQNTPLIPYHRRTAGAADGGKA